MTLLLTSMHAYVRVCTPFHPEATENQWMVKATFVAKSASDIHKLQNLERFAGTNTTHLLEAANKVYVPETRRLPRRQIR